MKQAYIILAHTKFEQLNILLNKINYNNNIIIVHIDKKVDNKTFQQLRSSVGENKNIHFIDERENGVWGDFTLVKATNNCIEKLLSLKEDFTHAILLSGMDFTIKSNEYINEFFNNNKTIDFIDCKSDSKYANEEKYKLYFFKFAHLFTNPKLSKFAFRLQYKMSYTLKLKRNHPYFHTVYFGSQWWALTKDSLVKMNQFIRENKKYVDFYKNTNIPDEFFFQTIVGNKFNTNIKEALHYMEWEKDAWHPNTLTVDSVDKMLNSNKLYARKIDIDVDKDIINYFNKL